MEKRLHERALIALPIRLRIEDIDEFVEEHSTELSEGGMFVEMNYPPEVGTEVTVEFRLKPVNKTILARGEVVHVVKKGGKKAGPRGMGIRFTHLDKDGMRFIELVVGKYNRAHPDEALDIRDGIADGSGPP